MGYVEIIESKRLHTIFKIIEQGRLEEKRNVARKLLLAGLTIEQIVEATDLTIEEVMELKKEADN